MNLIELSEIIKKCNLCPLSKQRINAVPGHGAENAKLFFIGEAPGANEDIQGIPFCGASGKFLNEMLSSIGLKREDVFITNVVKCRPPANRDPERFEIDVCSKHYLFEQIKLVSPKAVCLLGRHSMGLFLKNKKISEVHGKVFKWKDIFVIPLYHPAFALYNGSMRKVLLDDFQIIRHYINISVKKSNLEMK